MNKLRRLEVSSCVASMNDILEMISMIQEDEQNAYDNLPYGIQESDKGYKMEDNIESLDEAYEYIKSAIELLQTML